MIQAYKKRTSVAGSVCVIAVIGAAVLIATGADPKQPGFVSTVIPLLYLVAGIALICAAWFHIKAKGRSGWWILVFLAFNLLGLVIIALLKDHTTIGDKEVA